MSKIIDTPLESLLGKVPDPKFPGQSIIEGGYVQSAQLENKQALCILQISPDDGPEMEELRQKVEILLLETDNIERATVVLTAEKPSGENEEKAREPRSQPDQKNLPLAPDVKHIIAVASGKGGVGKSTMALNLASSLAYMGYKTGLMDADIYGPSIPKLTGLSGQKPRGGAKDKDSPGKIEPLEAFGLKIMSIGFMVAEETPMIWRGPMVQSAIIQLLRDVNWGELDYLIVDMPPGTGDAQLTLAQKVPLSGAVIISTPQDIALIDARKGLAMFEKVGVPVLGLIENMSYFECPGCGERTEIFGHGGARKEAEALNLKFLGEIPLNAVIRKHSDNGRSLINDKDSEDFCTKFIECAGAMIDSLQERHKVSSRFPEIVIE